MAGYLTTHVLDTARGRPAAGVTVTLWRIEGETRARLAMAATNADGRTDAPLLPPEAFAEGVYELVFEVGAYLRATGQPDAFLDVAPIRFRMSEPAHHHVPLLLSPFGYSTYRGS
jgi:5-hydroxyisourate hydrolase